MISSQKIIAIASRLTPVRIYAKWKAINQGQKDWLAELPKPVFIVETAHGGAIAFNADPSGKVEAKSNKNPPTCIGDYTLTNNKGYVYKAKPYYSNIPFAGHFLDVTPDDVLKVM